METLKKMQKKATKQSPAANAKERTFMATVKELPCCCCGNDGPSIVDHIYGSSKKLYNGPERVHVGHYAVIPLCIHCDNVKTQGSRRVFENEFGRPEHFWIIMIGDYDLDVPENVYEAILGVIDD